MTTDSHKATIPESADRIIGRMFDHRLFDPRYMEERGADPKRAADTWARVVLYPELERLAAIVSAGRFRPHLGMARGTVKPKEGTT